MPAEAASASSSPGLADFTRLHITPLDSELLKIILPSSVAAQARNISFHTIETFPEKRYGFVDLPQMEADKLKKKLNGSVLKGHKVRIEKARPEERIEPTGEVDQREKKRKKSRGGEEGSKKRKRDRDVVEGFTLTDRKVKRGWTEPVEHRRKKSRKDKDKDKQKDKDKDNEKNDNTTEKKKRLNSKYTDQEECLLKTKVPPNAVGNIPPENLPRKKRKDKSQAREVTVHEFEKTTKFPSFLKDAPPEAKAKRATEYVEGKGWVDEEGNVVESVKTKAVSTPKPQKSKAKRVVEREPTPEDEDEDDDDSTSSSGTSSSGSSSDEESEDEKETTQEDAPANVPEAPSSPAENPSPMLPLHATPLSTIKADSSRPMSSSSARSLTIKIPPVTPSAPKVHPLEALYKRSRADGNATETPAQNAKPFSFFGGDVDDADADDGDNVPPTVQAPMTPYTREDFEWRTVRSAAPTPDTAHPSRMKNFWAPQEEDDLEEEDAAEVEAMMHEGREGEAYDEEEAEEGDASAPSQQASSSDFQSWFWENRRELNRSWMKRRKTAAKEKRHRENKARASRAV